MDHTASDSTQLAAKGNAPARPGVYIRTFGCQMNEYDSEKMYALMSPTHSPVKTAEEAEVVIVNTCSVREKGEHKLFSLLGSLALLKQERPEMIIGVSGCVAQQEGKNILKRSKAVNFVVGTHNLSLVPGLVKQAREGSEATAAIDYREEWEELPDEFTARPRFDGDSVEPLQSAFFSPVRALVAIQRGCDKMCAFCVVPRTRGPQVSRNVEEILKEIRLKARLGAREVMLLGQTVNSFGLDLSPRVRFEDLIRAIADIPGIERIRFTSPHPAEVRPGFIELYGEVPQLCPHIHLPLQSGSDRILKLMNRNYRKKRYLQIVEQLNNRYPSIAMTSDMIVGFPTETEEDFQETMDVIRQVRYSSSYSFKYSRRPMTRAEQEFTPDQEVEEDVAQDRLLRLQELQDQISLEINQARIGSKVTVLVEGQNKKISSSMRGRIPQNTPIELLVPEGSDMALEVGDIVEAVVERASPHGLRGRFVSR